MLLKAKAEYVLPAEMPNLSFLLEKALDIARQYVKEGFDDAMTIAKPLLHSFLISFPYFITFHHIMLFCITSISRIT